MTDPIGAVGGPPATLPASQPVDQLAGLRAQNPGAATSGTQSLLDPQAFLQLLVAQLKYQDPSNPMDTSKFMNQTAMLSQVQSMNSMVSQVSDMISAQQTATATSMIGKAISYVDPSGNQASGVVHSVSIHHGVSLLHVGDVGVPLSGVLEVADAGQVPAAGAGTGHDAPVAPSPADETPGVTDPPTDV